MCFTVQLSRFLSVFDSSDILSYRFALVKNFFIFLFSWLPLFRDSFVILPCAFLFVKHFFSFVLPRLKDSFGTTLIEYHNSRPVSRVIFKNFFIKRRRRDLNPRTAWTVYTLSRGASSATWVLLLTRIHTVNSWAKFIILNESVFVNDFFAIFHFFELHEICFYI